jgi:phospholipid/cholesterol/gamma-HCH transport system permease protein
MILGRFFEHTGRIYLMLKGGISRPENAQVYWKEFMTQCNDIGIRSLPIVLVISVFLGMVLTLQVAYQLISPWVPKYIIAQLTRDTAILELSPTLICVVLAGVVGSKIASELGNMRVSEQIDALETLTHCVLVQCRGLKLIYLPLIAVEFFAYQPT